LKLEFEIRNGPQSANNDEGIFHAREIHEKAVQLLDHDACRPFKGLFDHGDTLVSGEKRGLRLILSDGDDEGIEELTGAVNDVDMPKGEGIETSGIYGAGYSHSIVAGGLLEMS
jgi:hypothetical protein